MVSNHMWCGIVKETLMLRVGPDNYEKCLAKNHTSEMNFTGKVMKGMVYVAAERFGSDTVLAKWVRICTRFVEFIAS